MNFCNICVLTINRYIEEAKCLGIDPQDCDFSQISDNLCSAIARNVTTVKKDESNICPRDILLLPVKDRIEAYLKDGITKAKIRTRMKWVAGSFLIQFATIFIISSPLFLLGAMGAFNDDGPGGIIIIIILLSAFIDINIVNILHQIGLKRSFIIVVMILVPIVFIMINLGNLLSQMP